MKCRCCEEEMWVNGLTGFICAYCGTDLYFDTQNKRIIWTIEEHKDSIEVINVNGTILKQL